VAAAAVAVGAAANALFIGPMVRCGPGLPAVFVIAFFAATRLVLQPHFVIWPGVVCRCHVDG
jgi:hypothetical protein